MNNTERWNIIASRYKEIYSCQESVVQKEWEDYFKQLFGYNSFFGEIDSQRSVVFGRSERGIPDIIIKTNGQDLFDVELKQYSLSFSDEMEEQLISYLDRLHISIGILVCQKIYVYAYDYSKRTIKKREISFVENNPDGIMFVELFQKENFAADKIEEFIDSKKTFDDNVEKIRNELTPQNILDIIKMFFEGTYALEEIERALQDLSIEIKEKSATTFDATTDFTTDSVNRTGRSTGGMDYTQYIFEGSKYGKAKLVLAVVRAYVRDNPKISYHTLKSIFYDDLQGSTGVVATPSEARKKRKDPEKRYYTNYALSLVDGPVWVCTQWGIENIGKFINKARSLGYRIDEV